MIRLSKEKVLLLHRLLIESTGGSLGPVSYTHLTMPTTELV